MEEPEVTLPLSELSTRQLMYYNTTLLIEMRDMMADLSGAVDELKAAVDGVAQRLLPEIANLEAALAKAQEDDADAAAAAAEAEEAVAAIRQEVDRLNALGADPSTPVDTEAEPVEPPEVEVPADPEAEGGSEEAPAEEPTEEAPAEDETEEPAAEEPAAEEGSTEERPRDPDTGQFLPAE